MINGVEYATVDQVRKMGLQATKQGAKQGEAMTLRRLQMSLVHAGGLGSNGAELRGPA